MVLKSKDKKINIIRCQVQNISTSMSETDISCVSLMQDVKMLRPQIVLKFYMAQI